MENGKDKTHHPQHFSEFDPLKNLTNITTGGSPAFKPLPVLFQIDAKADVKSKYLDRLKEVAMGLAGTAHGFEYAAYYMSDYIELAKYCIEQMAKEFGAGMLLGHEMGVKNSLKLPSDYLVEYGLMP